MNLRPEVKGSFVSNNYRVEWEYLGPGFEVKINELGEDQFGEEVVKVILETSFTFFVDFYRVINIHFSEEISGTLISTFHQDVANELPNLYAMNHDTHRIGPDDYDSLG